MQTCYRPNLFPHSDHVFRQVHDLLLPLIKNLEAGPVLHLYELMKELPVKEHTEQTIHLAQVLQKFIWTSGGTFSHLLQEASALQTAAALSSSDEVIEFFLTCVGASLCLRAG
jgi:hypothetical protein